MAFKEVTGSNNINSYWPKKAAERKVGDTITGIYRSKSERTNPDGSKSVLYMLETSDGMVGVNSSTTIARALEQIPMDSTIKIVYNGKARSQRTGREFNDFRVYLDDGLDGKKEDKVDLSNLDF